MGCASALGRPCRGACSHEERRDRVSVDTSARHRTTGLSPRFATLPSGGLNPRRAGVLLSRDTRSADARPMCISTFTPNPLAARRVGVLWFLWSGPAAPQSARCYRNSSAPLGPASSDSARRSIAGAERFGLRGKAHGRLCDKKAIGFPDRPSKAAQVLRAASRRYSE